MPIAAKKPVSKPGRLTSLYEYNRFRLELPTGKTYSKNGQEVPETEIHWLLGQRDADPKDDQLNNHIDLNGDQMDYIRNNKAMMALVAAGRLMLVDRG